MMKKIYNFFLRINTLNRAAFVMMLSVFFVGQVWGGEVTFSGENLNTGTGEKTVGCITLSSSGMSYSDGLSAGGGGKTFTLTATDATISQVVITTDRTDNRYSAANITNCTLCSRSGSVYTCVISPATNVVNCTNQSGAVKITQIEVTYTPTSDPAKTVYLDPNISDWKQENERYAVYYFESANTSNYGWVDMSATGSSGCLKMYQAEIPAGYDKCVFCRMDGSTTENDWPNKWNQTNDLIVANGMYCTITSAGGGDVKAGCDWNNTPFKVCVTGTWLRFVGETITLNATCAGATNYQWYKDGTAIAGATDATYTKIAAVGNGGNYTCKAWVVAGSEATSDAYGVRVPYLNIKSGRDGSDADIQRIALTRTAETEETASGDVYLGVGWDYGFFISDGVENRGQNNDATSNKMHSGNCTGWTMDNTSVRCLMRTTKEGTYTFTITFTNASYTPVRVSVTYPPMVQTAGRPIYMEKTPSMAANGWNNLYYRIGKGNSEDGNDENWATAYEMTPVPGTARYYKTTTPGWSNNFWAWHIGNNIGDANNLNGSNIDDTKYSVYKTVSSDASKAITRSINFSGDEILDPGWTIYLNEPGSVGTDGKNNNCTFYPYTHTDGMVTHDVDILASTNGQIKVDWTDLNSAAQSSEGYTARTLSDLAHTCILTITGVPDAGYKVASITAGGSAITSGDTYILADDGKSISATFEHASYNVTLNTNGGTINSGDVTTYTHGTGATLPTDVTNGSSGFAGWYDNSSCAGSPVISISTSATGDKEFWAKWSSCPAAASGETLYRFDVNSSVTGGNICSSGNNPVAITTPTQLTTLIGGTLEGAISSGTSYNNLVFEDGRITYKNGNKGVLNITLNCPLQEGDLIRWNIYSSSNDKYNYLRHTSNSTSSAQIKLTSSKSTTEIQQIIAPAAFDGKKELFIVSGSNTTGISYFEILRPVVVTLDAGTNGGTIGGNSTQTLYGSPDETIALPRAEKTGLRFKGWFVASSGGTAVSDSYTITTSCTLYAQFEDCPDYGMVYKWATKKDLTDGSLSAGISGEADIDATTTNYLATLVGGTATLHNRNNHILIKNSNFYIDDNAPYIRVDLDCELQAGDVFKTTISGNTCYVTSTTTRDETNVLPVGDLQQTPIPADFVGLKTLYLWRGGGNTQISYFEITRPKLTTITLSAPEATNSYTPSVIASYDDAMPAIAVLPVRPGFVFDGYYDGTGSTGIQYYNRTGNSMRNWDKEVNTATLYAHWLTLCEASPIFTQVAPTITIWDGKQVDLTLVDVSFGFDATGITYSLESATPAINGCTFSYYNSQIHIEGTPAVGNTATQTVTVTFNIANDCDPMHTFTVTQDIRIYPATQKAKIAFIVTGTEGKAFTAYTAADKTACSDLLDHLDDYFDITCVNGYATKDETALANYYKDYDLLVVTDFLNTGKGYTNAIGTLIDKKPILSLEAFVAGENGSNWHIGSNPVNPTKKVKDMKLLCSAHSIFSSPVVIKPDTTVNVLGSLSSHEDAKGLQGFTINEAPDFLFLATIRDTANSRDLIVCCERQAVFPARLMIYGVNMYEMNNMSMDGKNVMKQMIDYLLLTDESGLADCGLVFDDNNNTHIWSDPMNWYPGYNIVPTAVHPTRIIKPCTVDIEDAHAGSVKINRSSESTGPTGKITILPNAGLTVAGFVSLVMDDRYANLKETAETDVIIQADANHNGALVYGNKTTNLNATVEYYSQAEGATSEPVWQYIGIPIQAKQTAIQMYYAAWMCRWANGSTDGLGGLWKWVANEDILQPFEGYCITQEAKKEYTLTGALNKPTTRTLSLDNKDTDGYAFVANSWTAPIKISQMQDDDFTNAEKSIYIYHTGTYEEWEAKKDKIINTKTSNDDVISGQYAVIPINASPYIGVDSVIPAMQGFFVKTTDVGAKLKLVYNRVVYDSKYFKTSTQPMRAPSRTMELSDAPEVMVLTVVGDSLGADRVHILSRGDFSQSYEDGWDGRKVEGDAIAPKLSVVKDCGEMAVAAIETPEGQYLSFRAGEDSIYTFTFDYEGETIYLYDRLADEAAEIRTGNTYTFRATNKTAAERFLITATPPRTPTQVETVGAEPRSEKAEKIIHENKLMILYHGAVYDAQGARVRIGKEGAR